MDEQTRKLKADLLAGEILQLAHASLLLRLRFMEGARYGSEGYYRHNQALLVYERQETILRELDALELETP